MSKAPSAPFRLRIPTRLSVSPRNQSHVRSTLPVEITSAGRGFELNVAEFVPRAKLDPNRLPYHYAARALREDPRATQLLNSMRMSKRVGRCVIKLADDGQTAILMPLADGFGVATRYALHRNDEDFSPRCLVTIERQTRGLDALLLSDEDASRSTDTGDPEESATVRVLDAEINQLLDGIADPPSVRALLIR